MMKKGELKGIMMKKGELKVIMMCTLCQVLKNKVNASLLGYTLFHS